MEKEHHRKLVDKNTTGGEEGQSLPDTLDDLSSSLTLHSLSMLPHTSDRNMLADIKSQSDWSKTVCANG